MRRPGLCASLFGATRCVESLFRLGLLSNKPLAGLAAIVFVLQLAVVYVPFLRDFFQTQPLSSADLGLSVAFASLVFVAIEVEKWLIRRRDG